MRHKYGLPLTGSDWVGLPMRVGDIPADGVIHELAGQNDAVLLWTGGVTQVEIVGYRPDVHGKVEKTHSFVRTSGMIDLLPRGTQIKEIRWTGEETQCVSIVLPSTTQRALFGNDPLQLDANRGPIYGVRDAHIADLGTRLKMQAEAEAPLGAAYVQGLSVALAAYVAQRYNPSAVPVEPSGALTPAQRALLADHIERNLAMDLSVVDLSGLLGYSPDHFTRIFRKTFHATPHQFITQRRLERAKTLLRDPGQSLTNIALSCGFSSQSHLSVVFKRATGVTPGSYRRSH